MTEDLEVKCSFKSLAQTKLSRGLSMSEKDKECIYRCKGPQCIDYDGPKNKPIVTYSAR